MYGEALGCILASFSKLPKHRRQTMSALESLRSHPDSERGWNLLLVALFTALLATGTVLAQPEAKSARGREQLFARENLVAWCIVPFDARRRSSAERAAMLATLGFKRFAYDWRAEHVQSFDEEIAALARHGIALEAFWFPATLDGDGKAILAALKRNNVRTQLWVTLDDPAPKETSQAAKVAAGVKILRPIALAAAGQGCSVGLYNHGGWFGQPENQLAILNELRLKNVGLVYNMHHGHEHLERFEQLMKQMAGQLYCVNLNGMTPDGDRIGKKILPLGAGTRDLDLLRILRDSGYRGPIGILGHTDDDAELRLLDNLDGLDWLVRQLDGQPAGPAPKFRTFDQTPEKPAQPDPKLNGLSLPPTSIPNPSSVPPLTAADAERIRELAADAERDGNAERGLTVFRDARFACLSCHRVGEVGGQIGPALDRVGRELSREQVAEAILLPRRSVKPEYLAWRVLGVDGRSHQGYLLAEEGHKIELLEVAEQKRIQLNKDQIASRVPIGTLMPDGLTAAMSFAEQRDLVRFLSELGRSPGLAEKMAQVASHPHQAAAFVYDRAPRRPSDWPSWQHPVNRDRLYDFYAKQADFFRRLPFRPALLPAFPGLDGGKQGHWGNQNETVWRDDRWRRMDLGSLLCGVVHVGKASIPKGVCVRLGERGDLSACFDPETLTYPAVWKGGFLQLSDVRHGFLAGLRPDGEILERTDAETPAKAFAYRGFYRFGRRVIFSYSIGGREFLDAPWAEDGKFTRVVAPANEHPLRTALKGGAAQWPEEFLVQGTLGGEAPYAVDTVPLPIENPWRALLFVGGHDFLPDGSVVICTMQGDVWRGSGLDAELKQVRWRRIASGLHQPLGLVVRDRQIFVLGRDQITRLHDANGDGETDFYECFSNAQTTSVAGHDYICGLERDNQGRFYTASSKQGLIRVSADGKSVETLADGFRNPDGLGLAMDGKLTVPCSEGDWTCASMICQVDPTPLSQGSPMPHFGYGGPRGGKLPSLPLVYLPRGLDNSSGGQTAISSDRWGPLSGLMLHFSYGAGSHFLLLRDTVDGQTQGAVVPLPGEFRSGAHRGRFNPRDGQLYVTGMGGWGTYTPDDGCLHRVRYTGGRVLLPEAFHVHENGLWIRFTAPFDREVLADARNHIAQVWNYRYGPGYGSPEFSTRHPGVVGHDLLEIAAIHVLDDKTLFVELPDLQPVSQLHLSLKVDKEQNSVQGSASELFATIHKLDAPFKNLPAYRPRIKTIAAHPLAVDVATLVDTQPNPFRERLPEAREIVITAGQNLSFLPREVRVPAGAPLHLRFDNPDAVPHNWVLAKPGALERVGELANKFIADPRSAARQYVPPTEDVICYTDIVPPDGKFSIYFKAPGLPGRYPFLCTFPGHWMAMNGELVVE